MPRLPKLPSLSTLLGRGNKVPKQPVRQTTGREVSFQRRPNLRRSRGGGINQVEIGNPLEARAAQDVPGTLAFRIVLQELRRRQELFEYQDNSMGNGVSAGGFTVDFLITSRIPNVAIDIAPGMSTAFVDYPKRDEYKVAALESQRFRYAVLWSQDIEESQDRLEELLDDILGFSAGTYLLGTQTQPPEMLTVPDMMMPSDEGSVGGPPVQAPVDMNTVLHLLQNHHLFHEATGSDAISSAKAAIANVVSLKNNSGAQVPRGSLVKLDTTADNVFTTTATLDDTGIYGVTMQDFPTGGFGLVAIGGQVDYVRVASGTTRGQFLRQSTTTGIAEGTTTATDGTFAIALSNRDATFLTSKAVLVKLSSASGVSIFGTGSDGAVTISADTTLTSDKNYTNLTVNSTKVLTTGGYRVFVSGILTLTGTIANNGGVGGVGGNNGGGGGSAGTSGGTGSLGVATGFALAAAGNGGSGGTGVGGNGVAGGNGQNATDSVGGSAGSAGAAGGLGGAGTGGASGVVGAAGTAGTRTATTIFWTNVLAVTLWRLFGATAAPILPSGCGANGAGGGGAGGGGDGAAAAGGNGGGAGGNGGNGGPVLVCARIITGAGNFQSNAGTGGAGGNGGAGTATDTGGGGGGAGGDGGNGGIVVLVTQDKSGWTGSIAVTLGAAGARGSGGASGGGGGAAGAVGTIGNAGVAGSSFQLVNTH